MTEETTWLTPSAFEKLSAELEDLKTNGRRGIETRLSEARAHGDLRENGDYDAAKNDQGLMEARIRQLDAILAHAQVEEPADDGSVQIGSVVTVVDSDGDESEYFVANPENREPGFLLASPAGPLGQALIGARKGEQITYQAPGGTFTVTVKAVRPFQT
ncbi:MAG TPA: transcription elongation factor GreA [Acidimicrobiia bacterium]